MSELFASQAVILFPKWNTVFLENFDSVHIFGTMKMNSVQGDLTDISAETKLLFAGS